ncbi:MAG TPA: tRNA epoxyqueuosine(34) reductase QueG [Planctomycetaceae bacterium]|nr:tRNA epoxyqueuosine(34) reductase QueG [Planctomycetaceae bacterium]
MLQQTATPSATITTAGPADGDRARALAQDLKAEARRLEFDLVGIAPALAPAGFHSFLEWLEHGYDGEMDYLRRRQDAYRHPRGVLNTVRSVVMLGMNYRTAEPQSARAHAGLISRYAWGDGDYHDVLRERLRRLAGFLHDRAPGCRTRGVVDTAPLLERDFARLAGLGWFGKNTMLINKRAGSWLFLAGLLTDLELDCDQPHESSHCGTCTRCLDACPTGAFPEPCVLDARRCISYLTIELRDRPIPAELREGVGQWLFGCDICQEVCPWNRKAPASGEPAFQPRADLHPADAIELLRLNADEFHTRFAHTPLARPGRAGLLRNACIVLGNAGDERAAPALTDALADPEPLVRGAAAWALGRLGGGLAFEALRQRSACEADRVVAAEIAAALHALDRPGTDQYDGAHA